MAAPKRRKPGNSTARLESRAEAAWIKQNAKIEADQERAEAKQKEKADRERKIAEGQAEAETITRALQARLTELATLLASTLGEDPYVPFGRLKESMPLARFQPPPELAEPVPAPELDAFLRSPLSSMRALAPGRKRAHADAVAEGRAAYEQEVTAHAAAERDRLTQLTRTRAAYERALAADRERVQRQHAAIDQLARDFAAGQRKAVAELASCEYLTSRKELRYKKLTLADRNKRYQLIIAQMALRTLRCVFTADRADGGIDVVAVNKKEFVGGRIAIQAKRYAPHHKVPISDVREMVGSISQREFHKGIIITTSGYTSAAREEAARLGIELFDGENLPRPRSG